MNYTVKAGDSISKIARDILGDINRANEIIALNSHITNPNLIYPGQVIVLPDDLPAGGSGNGASPGPTKKTGMIIGIIIFLAAGAFILYDQNKKNKKKLAGAHEVRELEVYALNDSHLHESHVLPLIKKLKKTVKNGTYSKEKLEKYLRKYTAIAASKYNKEYGNPGEKIFTVKDQKEAAKGLVKIFDERAHDEFLEGKK